MVKRLFLILAMGAASSVSAQQLANGTFDAEWVNCYPWEKGAVVKNARGTQPEGWCIANVNGMGGLGATVVGAVGKDRVGDGKSVVVTNTPNPLSASQVVPGYFSLGTAWATAKATMAGVVTAGTADGGVFGGVAFTFRPDALHFYYKRAHDVDKTTKSPTNLAEKASIVAYTWKGTWTQADVPSNTSMSNPTKVTMTDRSNNILGKDCLTGGAVTKSSDAELISVIEYYIEGDQAEWKEMIIPFEYKNKTAKPEKLNIIFAANDLFADRAGIGAGNQLTIDDVELQYWNTLKTLTYDGEDLLQDGETNYEVNKVFDPEVELEIETKSDFADYEGSYNKQTAVFTIVVKREGAKDLTYTIQFQKPVTAKMVVNSAAKWGTFVAPFDVEIPAGVKAYTVTDAADNGLLTLSPVTSIKANTPVVLESEDGVDRTPQGYAVEGDPSEGLLKGVYVDTPVTSGYVLQNLDGRVGFYQVNGSITVPANRAYLNTTSNVKGFYFETATGIDRVESLEKKDEMYDLSGRRVKNATKGVYIVNGKKVLK